MTTYTSAELLGQDSPETENYHYYLQDGDKYILTEGELGWLDFVRGRYSIADHVDDNLERDENDNHVYTLDIMAMSRALDDDGMYGKAVMLDDETALQAIFFYNYIED